MSAPITKVIPLIPGEVQPLAIVEADTLTEQIFWNDYVCKHRPVLIKGAAHAWPALKNWAQPGYLESRCEDAMVLIGQTFNHMPAIEHAAEKWQHLNLSIAEIRDAHEDATLSMPAMRVPRQWLSDIGDYHFLKNNQRRPLAYSAKRIFFYKNASTEWHYHLIDETLTTQLLGTKNISLFRLTQDNWRTFDPIIKANFHHMPVGKRFFPKDNSLIKYEGILEAGDAVYIPPFWWHGIDTADSASGITLAQCFRSPISRFGHLRDPITRELLRDAIRFKKIHVLPLIALILASHTCRAIKKERWLNT